MITNRNQVKSTTENPCNMCMPLGAIIPFKGIENCMVIIHGSQGCATYMRRHMAEHFNEPIDVASSSITEKGTIFGGESNLKQGLLNLIHIYKPEVVGILSTCLAETIGEDIERIAAVFQSEYPDAPCLIPVTTPGYGGSHAEGYFKALHGIVATLSHDNQKHDGVNVFVPHISPADIREIKRILELMQVDYALLPDIAETLDSPYSRHYIKIPPGGTPLAAIRSMAGARASIQFGTTVPDEFSPGKYLETEYGVPLYNLPLPIGIEACDEFVNLLESISGNPVPAVLQQERGRLLDAMVDSHKYNREGRAAVFGEPETVYAVSRLLVENGVAPAILATGSNNKLLPGLLKQLTAECDEDALILIDSDFGGIRHYCSLKEINLAIGCSDGRVLTEKEGIPLVRLGFPIHDRIGGQRILSVGYSGTTMLLDQITNTLLTDKLNHYRVKMYRRFYLKPAFSQDHRVRRNIL